MEGVPGLEVTIQKHAEKENAEKAAKAAAVAAASASTTAPPVAEVHIPSNMPPTKSAKRQQETPGKRGVPKKAKVMEDDTEDGTKYLKTRVAKYFEIENEEGKLENVLYKGAVTEYDKESKFWHIIYDDGVSWLLDVQVLAGACLYNCFLLFSLYRTRKISTRMI